MWLFNGFPIITHVIAKRGQHYHYVYVFLRCCPELKCDQGVDDYGA